MKITKHLALIGLIPLLSGCFYYKSMPENWEKQVVEATKPEDFCGTYILSEENRSESKELGYNDFRYLQNTIIYGIRLVDLSETEKIKIDASSETVTITFHSNERQIHKVCFPRKKFKVKNNSLVLKMDPQSSVGGLVWTQDSSRVRLYKSDSEELFVCRKETGIGTVIIIPVIYGQNIWFKLNKTISNQSTHSITGSAGSE